MHAVFYMYGMKRYVDEIIKYLETRMLLWDFERVKPKKGEDKHFQQLMECQLRTGIGGTWEFIFPETSKDIVLTGLKFAPPDKSVKKSSIVYKERLKIAALRKALKLEKIPEIDTTKGKMALNEDSLRFVRIIPIGVRYDEVREVAGSGLIFEAI